MDQIQQYALSLAMCLAQPVLGTSMAHGCERHSGKCRCCATKEGVWKQSLGIKTHGCAVCHNVLSEKSWKPKTISNHRRNHSDLVCPRCTMRGYAPHRYESFQCTSCLETFGFRQFLHSDFPLKKVEQEVDPYLVCTSCRPQLRCSRCGESYEDAYWPRKQRLQHLRLHTKLVCKPCRAQGFHARDVVSYTCQCCKGKFGSRKFSRASLVQSWRNNCKTLKCKQCVAATKETKKAALTSGAAVAAAENDG